ACTSPGSRPARCATRSRASEARAWPRSATGWGRVERILTQLSLERASQRGDSLRLPIRGIAHDPGDRAVTETGEDTQSGFPGRARADARDERVDAGARDPGTGGNGWNARGEALAATDDARVRTGI